MEVVILFALIFGVTCSMIASSKGHNPAMGFLGGALFGIFSLIYYAVIPAKEREDDDVSST